MESHRKEDTNHDFDLIVVGGGLSGLCAAIAAARHGTRTAIIQDRPVFGGNASSEIRVVPHGAAHSNAWTGETGIVMEMIHEDRAHNHVHFFDHGMTNSLFDLTLLEFVRREPNLTSFLNTTIRAVDAELVSSDGVYNRRIVALHGSQMGSEKELVFTARQFIDATGDGMVGFLAGAEWRYGREARGEFNENLAPVVADEGTMGSTITMMARDVGRPVPFNPPPWIQIYECEEDIGLNRKLYHVGSRTMFGGYWWLEVCSPYHQIDDNEAIRTELHRHVLGVWNYIKNYSPDKEKVANYALEWLGMIPGKRESRRLMGDIIINENHFHEDQKWPDGIAYCGWWIDLHIPGGILNKANPGEREDQDDNYKHWIRISPVSLPLRAYYSRNIENLWMAGRCLSATHVGLGPLRVMLSLGLQGQSVGTAASYALEHNLTPRQTAAPDGQHILSIRQILLREDVHLLGVRNCDPKDLALNAVASATSEMALDFGEPNTARWAVLDCPWAEVMPLTAGRLETAEFYVKNKSGQSIALTAQVEILERIWDRPAGEPLASVELECPARFEGWLSAPFKIDVVPERPYRLILRGTAEVEWAYGSQNHPGTIAMYLYTSPGGPEERNRKISSLQPDQVNIPAYRHWRQTLGNCLAVRVTPQSTPFSAKNVNNGNAWPEDLPNLWVSDPAQALPQAITIEFAKAVKFNTVQVSFDTNLEANSAHKTEFWRAPLCANRWRLWALVHGRWERIFDEEGNYQRRRVARFSTVSASGLRLEVLATNGGPAEQQAGVYEIRVYNENDH